MTVAIELTGDIEERVRVEARRRSLSVEEYLANVVTQSLEFKPDVSKARAVLESLGEIGSEEEQKEMFEFLRQALDEDRLSERGRFA